MKTAVVLTGLLAALAISAQAHLGFIWISDLTVTNADNATGSNVTIQANINEYHIEYGGAQVTLSIKSTNGLVGQLFPPENITFVTNSVSLKTPVWYAGICAWTNTTWNPYFQGDYVVTVTATLTNGLGSDTSSTTVTVTRAYGGTMNSVKVAVDVSATAVKMNNGVQAYNPTGVWEDIDLDRVFVHSIGRNADQGAVSIPCNLMNNTNPVFVSEEQMDIAYMDTGAYKTNGTPFRFDMDLHARPTSIMGFGEIMRFVWTPTVATNPAGSGNLVVDVLSCQPWRTGYATNFSAHVGCAPLFMGEEDAELMEGMIMSTTAHYMDVSPDISEDGRMGLMVKGQSNAPSYLKAFIPDAMLERMGIPVDRATNLLAGYVTHYNAATNSEGTVTVDTSYNRIVGGGGTNVVYAYTSGTNGDSGYVARFNFNFHSPVAAQIGTISAFVIGDFDGDGADDPAGYQGGQLIAAFSGDGYRLFGSVLGGSGGIECSADFDGDGKADPAVYNPTTRRLAVLFSTQSYALWGMTMGCAGCVPVVGDFDGDGKADPAVYDAALGQMVTWLSTLSYSTSRGVALGGTGWLNASADYDNDGLTDQGVFEPASGRWIVLLSSHGWAPYGWVTAGGAGVVPVPGDYDADGKADFMVYQPDGGVWLCTFSRENYTRIAGLTGFGDPTMTPRAGDYDADGKADMAAYDPVARIFYARMSGSGYRLRGISLY